MTVQEVIAEIGKLSPQERRQVLAALQVLGEVNGVHHPIADDGGIVLQAIISTTKAYGIEFRGSAPLTHSPYYRAFKDKAKDIEEFLQSASKDRTVQTAIIKKGLSLLVANLREMRGSVTAGQLMQHIHRVPSLLDGEFPGYAKLGILDKFVRKG